MAKMRGPKRFEVPAVLFDRWTCVGPVRATVGLIPVWLSVDENEEIRRIIAPDIIHSQYFGWGARGRIFAYPSKDSQWTIVGGGKQQVEREFDASYVNGLVRSDTWTWSLHTNFDRSGTPIRTPKPFPFQHSFHR